MAWFLYLDRNNAIYELWEQGKTIDEISLLLNIPRSTVGYYVRKLNMAAKSVTALAIRPPSRKPPEQVLADLAVKSFVMKYIMEVLRTCDAATTYHTLAGMKLFRDLSTPLALTKEEQEMLFSAMREALKRNTSIRPTGQPKDKNSPTFFLIEFLGSRTCPAIYEPGTNTQQGVRFTRSSPARFSTVVRIWSTCARSSARLCALSRAFSFRASPYSSSALLRRTTSSATSPVGFLSRTLIHNRLISDWVRREVERTRPMAYYCEDRGHKLVSITSAQVHRRLGHTVKLLGA